MMIFLKIVRLFSQKPVAQKADIDTLPILLLAKPFLSSEYFNVVKLSFRRAKNVTELKKASIFLSLVGL